MNRVKEGFLGVTASKAVDPTAQQGGRVAMASHRALLAARLEQAPRTPRPGWVDHGQGEEQFTDVLCRIKMTAFVH